jgi:hypothetical protein
LRTNRVAAKPNGVPAPVGLILRGAVFRGVPCRLTQQHASRARSGGNPLRTNRNSPLRGCRFREQIAVLGSNKAVKDGDDLSLCKTFCSWRRDYGTMLL